MVAEQIAGQIQTLRRIAPYLFKGTNPNYGVRLTAWEAARKRRAEERAKGRRAKVQSIHPRNLQSSTLRRIAASSDPTTMPRDLPHLNRSSVIGELRNRRRRERQNRRAGRLRRK